eukprot:TRINITY_DN15518_c0_g3_i1.p1 TRINITY_DN15518_c0_g3~~TRINITY_DN15518_c0_g3_i1.p1  ORF type:complete len:876 (+),score=116.18 TRINITY_DN15518_c0_g3_i1:204-2630(+)
MAVLVPFSIAYAGIFTSPDECLSEYSQVVMSNVILTQALGSFLYTKMSGVNACANIDVLTAMFVAELARALKIEVPGLSCHQKFQYLFCAQAAFSSLAGASLWLLARSGGIRFLRFMPYPVMCGFISGISLVIVDGGFEVGTGMSAHGLFLLPEMTDNQLLGAVITVLASGIFLLLRRVPSALRWPFGLLIVSLCVHVGGRLVAGLTEDDLRARGLLLAKFQDSVWYSNWEIYVESVRSISLSNFMNLRVISLTVSFLSIHLLSFVFYISCYPSLCAAKGNFDVQHEIKMIGSTSFFIGLSGGVLACHSLKMTLVMESVGAKRRFWVVLLGFTLLAMYFFGEIRQTLTLVPKHSFAGLVMCLGCELLWQSSHESYQRVSKTEWWLVVVIALITWFHILAGICIGFLFTMGLFIIEYSALTGIVNEATLQHARSMVDRSAEEAHVLRSCGQEAAVFWCSGYIFFGTASSIVDRVEEYLDKMPCTRLVVVDFESVPAVDASGVHELTNLAARAFERSPSVRICFCGLVRRLKLALEWVMCAKSIDHGPVLQYPRVEHALEWAENEVLCRHCVRDVEPLALPKQLLNGDLDTKGILIKILSVIVPNVQSEAVRVFVDKLAVSATQHVYVKGTPLEMTSSVLSASEGHVIFAEGSLADDLVCVVSGTAVLSRSLDGDVAPKFSRHHLNEAKHDRFVFEERPQVKLWKVNAGGILGAPEFGAFQDGASAALQPCRVVEATAAPRCHVLRVPFANMRQALRSDPAIGQPVMEWLAENASRQMLEMLKSTSMKPFRISMDNQPTYSTRTTKTEAF